MPRSSLMKRPSLIYRSQLLILHKWDRMGMWRLTVPVEPIFKDCYRRDTHINTKVAQFPGKHPCKPCTQSLSHLTLFRSTFVTVHLWIIYMYIIVLTSLQWDKTIKQVRYICSKSRDSSVVVHELSSLDYECKPLSAHADRMRVSHALMVVYHAI